MRARLALAVVLSLLSVNAPHAADFMRGDANSDGRLSIADFRLKHSISAVEFPDLLQVNEHGEFTRGTVPENDETYKLATYGRIVGLTRQAIINDDLNSFDQMSAVKPWPMA